MSAGRKTRPHLMHRAVLELGERLVAEHDLASLLTLATDVVMGVIQTDVVAILELGPDRRSMRTLAAAGVRSAASVQPMLPARDPFAAEAIRSGAVVVVRDLMHDRRFTAPTVASRTMLSGITAGIYQSDSLPPPAGEGRVGAFGVIIARSWKPRSFTRAQVQVVEDTAALLGRALVRRANERRLRESEEQFRQLAERSPDALF